MTVMVEMPSALRQFADNQDELDSDGKNVEEVLADLCGRFPELKQNLYEDEGSIRNFINIYVNDCLLYTSPSPRDGHQSRMPSSA